MIWTEREVALAHELFSRGASEAEFLEALGKTKHSARMRLNRAVRSKTWTDDDTDVARKMLADGEGEEVFLSRLGRTRAAAVDRVKRMNHKAARDGLPAMARASSEALADARRRAIAPRSLTAWLCGDPAPGRSALDRRGASA